MEQATSLEKDMAVVSRGSKVLCWLKR